MHFTKIAFILLLMCAGINVHAQSNCMVSISYKAEPLAQVFNDLRSRCDVHFAYDNMLVRDVQVTISANNESLDEVLQKVLQSVGLDYKQIANTYAIIPLAKEEKTEAKEPAEKVNDPVSIAWTGEVRSASTNEPLAYATLQVKGTTQGTSTNEEGKFFLNVTLMPNDSIELNSVGYENKTIAVRPWVEHTSTVIYLEERKNYLPSVMIEAQRVVLAQSLPGTMQVVMNPNDLATSQGVGEADVMRAAQLLPGISATQESSSGLSIRGSATHQTLVQFDGYIIYHLDHFFGAFSALNSQAVKSMRIMKSAIGAEYGGRAGGMVEVIGKEGNTNKPSAQIDIGSISLAGVVEVPIGNKKNASLLLAGRRAYTDALFSPTYKELFNNAYNSTVVNSGNNQNRTFGSASQPDYNFHDAHAKLTYRPDAKNSISISMYAGKDRLNVTYADTADTPTFDAEDYIYADESVWKSKGAGAKWMATLNTSTTCMVQAGISNYQTDFFSRDTIISKVAGITYFPFKTIITNLKDANLKAQLTKRINHHKLDVGYQLNAMNTSLSLGINSLATRLESGKAAIHSLYVQDDFPMGSRWTLIPGIRLNYFANVEKQFTDYRFSAYRKSVDQKFTWKFYAGRVHQFIQRVRQQSFYQNTPDLWRIAGYGAVPVLISDQISTGFHFQKRRWSTDAEAYVKLTQGNTTYLGVYNGMSEQYDTDSLSNNGQINGHGLAAGADFMLQYDAGRLHAWAGYSMLRAYTDYKMLDEPRVSESFEHRHEIKFYAEMETKRWDISVLWIYGSGRPYTPLLGSYTLELPGGESRSIPVYGNLNSRRLTPYHRLDVSVSFHFSFGKTRGKITFSCFNAYNKINVSNRQYTTMRHGTGADDYSIGVNDINMLGIIPSLSLQLQF